MNSNSSVFEQVSQEVHSSIKRLFKNPDHERLYNFLKSPDRVIKFKVRWQDRNGQLNWNTGYRIQFNNVLGPYKGGLRFHKSVNEDILQALAFEQTFKNSLTGLNMGGGKGGSDFDPSNKTEGEIRNFCQSYMRELYKYIGEDIDVPAGDIGVGGKEIGYMYGEYRKLTNSFTGVLTGKGLMWGGSQLRPEATGYGVIYFLENMVNYMNDTLENKTAIITGAGNVATFAIEKALEKKINIVAMNDVSGSVYFSNYLQAEHLQFIKSLYENRKTLADFANQFEDVEFYERSEVSKPWFISKVQKLDLIIPCATQNEIVEADAKKLVELGVKYISEGSNMSCNLGAIDYLVKNGVFFGPSKACNAGGVSVSGLEMIQNSSKIFWNKEEVDSKLKSIMRNIFYNCVVTGENYKEEGDLKHEILIIGANIAGFLKVSEAMKEQGYFY